MFWAGLSRSHRAPSPGALLQEHGCPGWVHHAILGWAHPGGPGAPALGRMSNVTGAQQGHWGEGTQAAGTSLAGSALSLHKVCAKADGICAFAIFFQFITLHLEQIKAKHSQSAPDFGRGRDSGGRVRL